MFRRTSSFFHKQVLAVRTTPGSSYSFQARCTYCLSCLLAVLLLWFPPHFLRDTHIPANIVPTEVKGKDRAGGEDTHSCANSIPAWQCEIAWREVAAAGIWMHHKGLAAKLQPRVTGNCCKVKGQRSFCLASIRMCWLTRHFQLAANTVEKLNLSHMLKKLELPCCLLCYR